MIRRSHQDSPLKISGDAARYDHRKGNDDYSQARTLFEMFDAGQKARLFANIAASTGGVPSFIIERALLEFDKIHPDYATGIAEALAVQ